MKILDACLVHVEDREEPVLLGRVDTDLDLLQVGHVVLPLHWLQPGPQHPQSDGVVAQTGQQDRVLLSEGISDKSSIKHFFDKAASVGSHIETGYVILICLKHLGSVRLDSSNASSLGPSFS